MPYTGVPLSYEGLREQIVVGLYFSEPKRLVRNLM